MQLAIISWAKVRKSVMHATSLGMVVLLLVGAVFAALPAGQVKAAALCTNVASGTFSAAATWDCGHVPTSADDVSITNGEVVISTLQSVNNLTIGDLGVLTFVKPVTLDINGNMTVAALGLLDPGDGLLGTGGMIRFAAAGMQTITTNGEMVAFWNLKKVATGAGQGLSFDTGANGRVLVLNNLILRGTATNNLVLKNAVANTQWTIESDGPRDLNWLDVQYSNNDSAQVISVVNWVSSGNNSGWATNTQNFSSVAVAATVNPVVDQRVEVLLTFHVYPSTATGQVTFLDGGVEVPDCESIPLTDSEASCSVFFSSGVHPITVSYNGDGTFSPAISIELDQIVNWMIFIPAASK